MTNCPIDKYRGIHKGASIAVLGSSPTLELYKGKEDLAIAVNGSVMGLNEKNRVHYFMCGDKESHLRSWFLESEKFGAIRIVSSFVLPYDPIIIPDLKERKYLQKKLLDFFKTEKHHIEFTLDDVLLDSKHGFFYYSRPWKQIVSRRQKKLSKSSTISGVAAQMAFVMGAKEIHLYGCSFGDVNSVHYSYDNKGEPGGIKPWQPTVMDFVIHQIMRQGVEVYSHGYSALRMPIKLAD